VSNHKTPRVHLDRDGRARCGQGAQLTASQEDVTCMKCADLIDGIHTLQVTRPSGYQWLDVKACGTPAAYRRHLRLQGKPVRCETCLQGERRRAQDGPNREAFNARRRERYAAARAAGMSAREANILANRRTNFRWAA
jgi:hypothetical protein